MIEESLESNQSIAIDCDSIGQITVFSKVNYREEETLTLTPPSTT